MKKLNNINSGIYGIYTFKNNLLYIGNTNNLEDRYKTHYYLLKNKKHENKELLKLSEIYGFDNIIFKPIFLCDKEDLLYWETFFIKLLNPVCNKTFINRNEKLIDKLFTGPEYDAIYSYIKNNKLNDIIRTSDLIELIYNEYNIVTSSKKIGSVLNRIGYVPTQLKDGTRIFKKHDNNI